MVLAMALQRTGTVARTDSSKLQHAQAAGCHDAAIKIHQHGCRRSVGIMTRGTSGTLFHNVQVMLSETTVGQHAVLNVVALIAQRVIG